MPHKVYIKWNDASELGSGGWMTKSELECDSVAHTCAWLVRDEGKFIDVAHSYSGEGDERQWLGGLRIPRSMIIEMRGESDHRSEE